MSAIHVRPTLEDIERTPDSAGLLASIRQGEPPALFAFMPYPPKDEDIALLALARTRRPGSS